MLSHSIIYQNVTFTKKENLLDLLRRKPNSAITSLFLARSRSLFLYHYNLVFNSVGLNDQAFGPFPHCKHKLVIQCWCSTLLMDACYWPINVRVRQDTLGNEYNMQSGIHLLEEHI